ncbi:MAG: OFA family MFS transporter [Deltaproteobacteria bacterium]|nr:OFA family MFS transporter [Deltaproteobacteria bacterium]
MDRDIEYYRKYRWFVISIGLFVMMVISIYQYSWSLFAYSLAQEFKWDLATIGLTFTVFAYTATFIQPFSGYIADSFGPRKVSVFASVLVGVGFLLSSLASSPGQLYFFYGLGGVGVGILYGLSTASAIKWFPEKRGFATGLVVFGFGAGTAIFNWMIQGSLEANGFRTTLQYLGFLMLGVLVPASFFYKFPPPQWMPQSKGGAKKSPSQLVEYRPAAMMGTYQWYLIYFCFAFTVSIVLLFGAQMKMVAKEYQLPKEYFDLLLVLFPLGNGLSRIVAGAVSDRVGREKTMVIFYGFLGFSILALLLFGTHPLLFVMIVFIAALLGGAPFALYPATVGDYYGSKYSTVNYGITYTAKAWAGLISGWLSGYFVSQMGSYRIPLIIIAICSLLAAFFSNPRIMRSPQKKS